MVYVKKELKDGKEIFELKLSIVQLLGLWTPLVAVISFIIWASTFVYKTETKIEEYENSIKANEKFHTGVANCFYDNLKVNLNNWTEER